MQRHLSSGVWLVLTPVSRKPACGKLPCRIDGRKDRSSLVGPKPNHYWVRHHQLPLPLVAIADTPVAPHTGCKRPLGPCHVQNTELEYHTTAGSHHFISTILIRVIPRVESETLGHNDCLQDPTPASPSPPQFCPRLLKFLP